MTILTEKKVKKTQDNKHGKIRLCNRKWWRQTRIQSVLKYVDRSTFKIM